MSRNLYPKISAYRQEWFRVDDTHQLYIEESGNPEGIPVVYLHGGPGGGSSENHRRYFNPEKYRIILFDQRGCGRSKPSPCIENNTTEHLILDLEKIRKHLNVERWVVAGGSWGTTLALAYGIQFNQYIEAFILRGIFLGTKAEYQWLYDANGAARFYPEYFAEFLGLLDDSAKASPIQGFHHLMTTHNELKRLAASKAWCLWELRLSTIEHHNITMEHIEDPHQALCMAMLSTHYFKGNVFLAENYLLDNIAKIAHIPAIIIHGRYDMVCQLSHAYTLSQQWDNAELQILPHAGHSGFERQTIEAICQATDSLARFFKEK